MIRCEQATNYTTTVVYSDYMLTVWAADKTNNPIKMTSVLTYHMTSVLTIARPRQYICILSVKNSNEIQWGKTRLLTIVIL
jgi:hypothetical protein